MRRTLGKLLVVALVAPLLVGASATTAAAADDHVTIAVSPGPQVAVGQTTTVTATLVSLDPGNPAAPGWAYGRMPDAFDIVSASSSVGSCGIHDQVVLCVDMVGGLPQQVTIQLRPLRRAYDQVVPFQWANEHGNTTGPPAVVDVIDPTVTADVHAEATGPERVVVGEAFAVDGTIISAGSTGVSDVTAAVSVDPALGLTSVTWGSPPTACPIAGGVATCTVGALGPWTAVPFHADVAAVAADPAAGVSVTVATTSPVDAPDPYPDTTVHPVEVVDALADVGGAISPSHLGSPFLGLPYQFLVFARSSGYVTATGTEVTVELPPGLTLAGAWLSVSPPPGATGCTVTGQTAVCGVGDLAVGSSAPVWVEVVPTAVGDAPVTLTVTTATPEITPDPTPNVVVHTFPVGEPWLDASATFRPQSGPVVTGRPASFVLEPTTDGPVPSADATVELEAPEGWQLVSASESWGGTSCAIEGRFATCLLAELPTDRSGTTVPVTVVPDDAGPGTLRATISTPWPDPDPSDDVAELVVTAYDPFVDLEATYSQVDTHWAKEDGAYRIGATNRGTGWARDVVITAPVPPAATLVSAVADGSPCEVAADVVTCTRDALAVGATFTAEIVVHHSGDLAVVPVEASVASSSPEPVPDLRPNQVTETITLSYSSDEVAGSVVDPSGAPVPGVAVRFFRAGAFLPEVSVLTDAQGHYSATFGSYWDTTTNPYAVQFVPPATSGLAAEWFDDVPTRGQATTLALGYNSADHRVDAQLGYFGSLPSAVSGSVAVDGGVPGTPVAAHLVGDEDPTATTTVGPGGSYSFDALPPGRYVLAFLPPPGVGRPVVWSGGDTWADGGYVQPTTPAFTVDGSGSPVAVPHRVVTAAPFGTVTDPSGAPVGGVEARLVLPGAPVYARSVMTGSDGTFAFPDVDAGDYEVLLLPPVDSGLTHEWWDDAPFRSMATALSVTDGGVWPELEVELRYTDPQPSDVAGTVSVDEGPVEGGLVAAYEVGDGFEPTATTTVGPDGSFAFEDLPIGTYALGFGPPAGVSRPVVWSGGAYARGDATTFSIFGSGAPIALGNQELVSWGSLGGTVTDGSGAPMAGVEVLAFRPGQAWVPQHTAVTAADGTWSLPEVLPDRYQLLFRPPSSSGLPQRWFDGTALRVSSTWVQVGSNADVGGIDAAMAAWATVSGTVTGPGGPVAGVRVAAYAPDDAFVGSREVLTDVDGRYEIRWLDPGTYKLRFLPPGGSGLASEWFDDVATRSAATGLVVAEGAQLTGFDAALAPAP